MRATSVVGAAALAAILTACTPTGKRSASAQIDTARLTPAFDRLCATSSAPGISAAVVFPDGEVWARACGVAARGEPLRPDHLLGLGSITKTYTAALIMDLVREGRVALNDTVAPLLPHVAGLGGVTIRHLLQHTSGLYDYTDHPEYLGTMREDLTRAWTAGEVLVRFGGERVAAPGERWDYSNTNYLVLGLLAESLTERPVHDALRDRMLEPRGLTHTFFSGAEGATGDVAHAFIDINGDGTPEDFTALSPSTSFTTSAWTAGALAATAEDAARWMRAFGSGEAVGDSLYAEMTTWRERGDGMAYGLGLIHDEGGPGSWVGHKGNSVGYSASVWYVPGEDLAVAVLTNAHQQDVTPVATALVETLIGGVGVQLQQAMRGGGAGVVEAYRSLRPTLPQERFDQQHLNTIGYAFLSERRVEDAILVFELNVAEYPDEPNPYDSLGDAYSAAGRLEDARESYARAVELATALSHPNLETYSANLERVSRMLERH